MAAHRGEGKYTEARQKEGEGSAKPWYETSGKILTPVQGFSAPGITGEPPRPAALRGDTKPEGTGTIPLSAKNKSSNALGAFGMGGKRPGGKD